MASAPKKKTETIEQAPAATAQPQMIDVVLKSLDDAKAEQTERMIIDSPAASNAWAIAL